MATPPAIIAINRINLPMVETTEGFSFLPTSFFPCLGGALLAIKEPAWEDEEGLGSGEMREDIGQERGMATDNN